MEFLVNSERLIPFFLLRLSGGGQPSVGADGLLIPEFPVV